MAYRIVLVVAVALVACVPVGRAQQTRLPEGTVRVVLVDGDPVVGTIVRETAQEVELETRGGVRVTIPRAQIRAIESVAGQRFLRLDPNRSRLLFAPTARPLARGRGYVADYEVFFPSVAYAPSSSVILSGGVSILPGSPWQLLYLTPKVTFVDRERVAVAGGVMVNTVLGDDDDDDIPVFGLVYGVTTLGRPERSLTVGAALGYADGDFAEHPVLLVGGEVQLSNSVKLLTENYVVVGVEDGFFFSGGIRFFGERLAADLGIFTAPELLSRLDGFPGLPWVGFSYSFGR